MGREITLTADDFGLSLAVNEAVERAHREGVLDAASLMVAGPAAADAVARAKRLPGLRVGLHLVVIEGPSVLPPETIPDLVDAAGRFPSDQLALGLRYFFLPRVRRQLAAEIGAQFAAFAATGLRLGHADAHKHMHLHPTVAAMMIAAGRAHGLRTLRVPMESPSMMRGLGVPQGVGARAMAAWTRVLRGQARRAGMVVPDRVVGLAWTGGMTEARVLAALGTLREGRSEIYFHPASRRDAEIDRWMPGYAHEAELAALLSPRVAAALARLRAG